METLKSAMPEGRFFFINDGSNEYRVETDILTGSRQYVGTIRKEKVWVHLHAPAHRAKALRWRFRAFVGGRLMGEAKTRIAAARFLV